MRIPWLAWEVIPLATNSKSPLTLPEPSKLLPQSERAVDSFGALKTLIPDVATLIVLLAAFTESVTSADNAPPPVNPLPAFTCRVLGTYPLDNPVTWLAEIVPTLSLLSEPNTSVVPS